MCVPCISVSTVREIQKVLFLKISPEIQACAPQPLQVRVPPSRTQSTLYHSYRSLEMKNHDFVRCIRILKVRNSRKKHHSKIFLDIQTLPHLSPKTTGFTS